MKNIILSLTILLLVAACSSGSSVAPTPTNVTSNFTGNYQSNNNLDSGTVTLDQIENSDAGTVAGNIIFQPNPGVASTSCLQNTTVAAGTNNGFNISITSNEITNTINDGFVIVTTTTIPDNPNTPDVDESATNVSTVNSSTGVVGTQTTTQANGVVVTQVTTEAMGIELTGTINITLAISNEGNTLSGTYVTTGDICSNNTGTGEMTLNRT